MGKYLVLGYGSMGRRHARNIAALRPAALIIVADPYVTPAPGDRFTLHYPDWRAALAAHPDATGAVIASPHEYHPEQMAALAAVRLPFLVEKPLGAVGQAAELATVAPMAFGLPCAVGFNYRFHPIAQERHRWASVGRMAFYARDNLAERYGPSIVETMTSHAIDLALWTLGPARYVALTSDGLSLTGAIVHERGESTYDQRLDRGPRESLLSSNGEHWGLAPDETMYTREMAAWLEWAETGLGDDRLATLADGLAVQGVMEQVKR